jgi:hypothetical protein
MNKTEQIKVCLREKDWVESLRNIDYIGYEGDFKDSSDFTTTVIFIAKLLSEQRQSILEEVDRLRKIPNYQQGGDYEEDEGFNKALDTVLKIINR